MVRVYLIYLFLVGSFFTNAQESLQITVKEIQTSINGEIYSPAFKDSFLIVCGTRKDRVGHTHLDKDDQEPIDLYVLNEDSSYAFSRFDKKFRSDFHDGPISFNKAGTECVVSRNLRLDQRFKAVQKDENLLGLFISHFENGQWIMPEPLLVNSKEYNCTHPALSADGNKLIFSSNMPGGKGGYDLWQVEKTNGIWGKPKNLGSGVNTSANEFFPTWIGNIIYFSSNRASFGGLDVYQIEGKGEKARTRLLDEPLNSAQDDFGLISKNQGRSGYFTSNRSGSDQLWSYNMIIPEFNNCDSIVNDEYCYSLVEETAYELGGIESLVYKWDINGVKKFGYEIDYCFPGVGVYEINVDIFDTIVQKTYANQASYTLELTNEEQPYITSPDSILVGQEFDLDPSASYLPGVEIDSYFWFISDGSIFTTKNPVHTFEEAGEYQVKLGIIGTKYGQPFKDCSYKYMIATTEDISQVEPSKMENKPVVKRRPTVESERKNVVHSIEIARTPTLLTDTNEMLAAVMDRYIVNALFDPTDSIYVYSVGEWLRVSDAHETWLNILDLGYDNAKIYTHERDSMTNVSLSGSYSLENVQFDNGKWEVKDQDKETLNLLVLLLKEFEDVKLLIVAHTDNVGNTTSNLTLSENRAEAILLYLTESGIDRSRLMSKGLGESMPKYLNDTPEGRSKNRRVEFKLITTGQIETLPE